MNPSHSGRAKRIAVEELIYGFSAVEAVARLLYGTNVPDGVALKNAFGHLVHQGFCVPQAYKTAELPAVHPVALGGCCVEDLQQAIKLCFHGVNAVQDLLGHGRSRSEWMRA